MNPPKRRYARDATRYLVECANSIEKSFTGSRSAETRNSVVAAHFALEFVVVRQLLICRLNVSSIHPLNKALP